MSEPNSSKLSVQQVINSLRGIDLGEDFSRNLINQISPTFSKPDFEQHKVFHNGFVYRLDVSPPVTSPRLDASLVEAEQLSQTITPDGGCEKETQTFPQEQTHFVLRSEDRADQILREMGSKRKIA